MVFSKIILKMINLAEVGFSGNNIVNTRAAPLPDKGDVHHGRVFLSPRGR
jgi:hypothetical protein